MHTPNFPEISLNFRSKSSIRPTRNFVCITFAQLFTSFARSFLVRRAIISSSTNSLRIEIARRVNQTLASKDFWLLLKTHKAKFGICLQEATEDSLKAEKRKLQREVCLIHSHFYRVFIYLFIYLFIDIVETRAFVWTQLLTCFVWQMGRKTQVLSEPNTTLVRLKLTRQTQNNKLQHC